MKKYTKKRKIIICIILISGLISIPVSRGGYFFVKGFRALINQFDGEAVRQFEKSIKANPCFLEAYICLAMAYTEWESRSVHYKEHNKEELAKLEDETLGKAEQALKTALRRFPYHPYRDDIQYMLGRIYDEDSTNGGCVWDRKKAVEGYRELIKRYPKSRYVKKAKERINSLEKNLSVANFQK